MRQIRVCMVPKVTGVGGMVSFRQQMSVGMMARGIITSDDLNDTSLDAVLVIGGTRQIKRLWQLRRRGIRIVQRLDGINWLHRVRRTGLRHYLRAEYGNMILRSIRDYLADRVVYQSDFAQTWWEESYGLTRVPNLVVYNGVDLREFSPEGLQRPPEDRVQVLLVEGNIMGGYELGLEHALEMVLELDRQLVNSHSLHQETAVELKVIGQVSIETKEKIEKQLMNAANCQGVRIYWAGLVSRDQIPKIDRSAHLLYSADINPACPNAVIEALACGTPVVAFDTGALPELVAEGAGKVVSYGGNPWKLERPDIPSLTKAALEILDNRDLYSRAARARAETVFGLDRMVERYLEVLLG